jgi:hypothetical protein
MKDDILCKECSEKYATLLRSAKEKTSDTNIKIDRSTAPVKVESGGLSEGSRGQVVQTLSASSAPAGVASEQLIESQLRSQQKRAHSASLIGYMLLGLGLLALAVSILFASTILAFIGLGLAFWGMLMFFIQPQNYVRSDLLNATAMSSLKTIDRIMLGMGYGEKGVYIPTNGPDKIMVFVPSEPFSMIPQPAEIEGKTSLTDPAGLLVVPPGLALSNLIEKKLGFALKNCGIDTLVRALPKVLTEDLEIVRDFEAEVKDDRVEVKLVDSIYADFCREVRDSSRRCGLGCPMCSALACMIALASGKPVLFEEDRQSADKKTTESSYQLLTQPRL